MTGNVVLDLVISLAGVAVLVGVSWVLGGWNNARVDEDAVNARVRFDEPDFQVGSWLISADGKAAVAVSRAGGEAMVVFAIGDGLATRRFRVGACRVERNGAEISLFLGDPSRRKVRVIASKPESAARWAGDIGGEGYI